MYSHFIYMHLLYERNMTQKFHSLPTIHIYTLIDEQRVCESRAYMPDWLHKLYGLNHCGGGGGSGDTYYTLYVEMRRVDWRSFINVELHNNWQVGQIQLKWKYIFVIFDDDKMHIIKYCFNSALEIIFSFTHIWTQWHI